MKGGFFETLSALDEFNDNEICGIVGLCMCQFRKSFGLKSVVTSFFSCRSCHCHYCRSHHIERVLQLLLELLLNPIIIICLFGEC